MSAIPRCDRRVLVLAVAIALIVAPLPWHALARAGDGRTDVQAVSGMQVSVHADRSQAQDLEAARLTGSAYIFLQPPRGAQRARFYINDASTAKKAFATSQAKPFNLAGEVGGAPIPLDTTTLSNGAHTVTVLVDYGNGREIVSHASMVIHNEATPQPAGRSGLTFTAAELAEWRTRAVKGPYRVAGDAGANSPGDWQRISSNASAFAANPSAGRYRGPSTSGCVQRTDSSPKFTEPSRLRDAAFSYLVTDNTTYRNAVKNELLAQAAEPGVDFTNTSRWCNGKLSDGPLIFGMSEWLTKLAFAYDYLGSDSFTAAERKRLDDWFRSGAIFMNNEINSSLNDNFVDRRNDNYNLSTNRRNSPGCRNRPIYYGGPDSCSVARYYNNRRANMAMFVAVVGVAQNHTTLKQDAARFAREYVAYSVYPDGSLGDFERWSTSLPDLGWAYSANALGSVVTIADVFARSGDTSLYSYSTRTGAQGTEASSNQPAKSIKFAIDSLNRYVTGGYNRYATTSASENGNAAYRIDGINTASNWHSVHDMALVTANRHYNDSTHKAVYTRKASGLNGYPRSPASNGPQSPWTGPGGVYPAMLLMYGQP